LNVQSRREGFIVSRASAANQEARVLEHLRRAGPCTDHELSVALGFLLRSTTRARCALKEDGRVVPVGRKKGEFGVRVTLWAAVGEK
jgi:hypothetical protein